MKKLTVGVTVDFIASQMVEIEVDDNFDETNTDAIESMARDHVDWDNFEPELNDILCVDLNEVEEVA